MSGARQLHLGEFMRPVGTDAARFDPDGGLPRPRTRFFA
jgi:hypothetical protein